MKKAIKWLVGAVFVGAAAAGTDMLYDEVIEDKLPERLQRSLNDPREFDRSDALYWTIIGAGAIPGAYIAAKIVNRFLPKALKADPIKPGASPAT